LRRKGALSSSDPIRTPNAGYNQNKNGLWPASGCIPFASAGVHLRAPKKRRKTLKSIAG
jgi:hypothetical protein